MYINMKYFGEGWRRTSYLQVFKFPGFQRKICHFAEVLQDLPPTPT